MAERDQRFGFPPLGFVVLVFTLALLSPTSRADRQVLLIDSPSGKVFLNTDRGSISVIPSVAEAPLVGATESPALWTLEWMDADGKVTGLSADATDARVILFAAELGASIQWEVSLCRVHDTTVTVNVAIDSDSTLRWRLSVKTGAEGRRLHCVHFPVLGGIPAEGALLVQPHGWGLLRENLLEGGPIWCNWPGIYASMQFLALQTPQGLVYLGAEDSQGFQKFFVTLPDPERNALGLRISQFPETSGSSTRAWSSPYGAAAAILPGATWFEAARRYREWTYSAPWGRCRLETKKAPEWLAEIDLWVCHEDGAVDATGIRPLLNWENTFKVPSAAHWYRWHEIPHDIGYPEYFPPKLGSFEAFRKAQSAGLPVMPYINGRLWDIGTQSWKIENASQAATQDARGNVITELYYTKIPLAVMCPSTELWQKTISEIVGRLARDVQVDAIYIDQIGAADAVRCEAENHPHSPGGGDYWVRGYREMLLRCRQTLKPNQAITTEECSDPWNDLIDGFLMVNTRGGLGRTIPLYPAVYGGRTIYFGFQYIAPSELSDGFPLRSKLARSFAWGGQLGWVRPSILAPEYDREVAFLKELALIRSECHAYLQYGRMLPCPRISGPAILEVTTYTASGFHPESISAVAGGLWEAYDKTLGLALCNWTDTDHELRIESFQKREAPQVIALEGLPRPSPSPQGWRWRLPARRAAVLVWERKAGIEESP